MMVALGLGLSGAATAITAAPSVAATPTVTPTLDCVAVDASGEYTAYFGYVNTGPTSSYLDYGDANEFIPGDPNQSQPEAFAVGSYPDVVAVPFLPSIVASISWVLDGQVVTASADSTPCVAGRTGDASSITSNSAVLNGLIDPVGHSTTYQFQWGTSPSSLQSTALQTVTAADPQLVSASLSGLAPATTYYYELVADNGRTSTTGMEASFTTAPTPTVATTSGTGGGTVQTAGGSTGTPALQVTPAVATAALSLSARASWRRARTGHELRYRITAANRGQASAAAVTAHLALPAGASLLHSASCHGRRLITCALGMIAPGAERTLTVWVKPRANVALATLVFLTTSSPSAGTTGDFVTLHTAADPRPGGSSIAHSRRDRSHQPITRAGRARR